MYVCRIVVGCVLAAAIAAGCSSSKPAPATVAGTPLYDTLGNYHFPIKTSSPDAQRYFDQGFTLSYAFNHGEAIRSFQGAVALDPTCVMCYWGIAFALGPNINAPITEAAAKAAYEAIAQARQYAPGAPERERRYVEALARRYAADPRAERAPLDKAYADAMRELARRYPDDLDAATLFAQSLMDTSPWNYWNMDGSPRPLTNEVLAALESVLSRKPDHLGAIHLYIHAVEASPNPGRAQQYADRLPALAPGAGHLVHMPAHVYLRTGRYDAASQANRNAIKADETYLAGNRAAGNMTYEVGYYTHNIHFLVTSASMEGRRADAIAAADELRAKMPADMMADPAMGGMVQHMWLTPLFARIRFGMWDEVLADTPPPDGLVYAQAIAHAGRGLAFAATGRVPEAQRELAQVRALQADPSLKTTYVSSVNTASAIVAIASEVLAGEIAVRRRNADEAARRFAAAAALEDGLTYMEPPDWPIPVRQLQGAALLDLGRTRDAEAAFRRDLAKFPDNGWALSGLRASVERQGRTKEAADIQLQFDRAWRSSDTQLVGGRAAR